MASKLDVIAEQVRICQKCDLCQTRTNAVPGKGNLNAEIILIGEAPGRNEDKKGEPFVGSAGKRLNEIADKDERLIVHGQKRDWDNKRFAVYDGLQKAMARAICTGEFCWQQDSDEVVHERDYGLIK